MVQNLAKKKKNNNIVKYYHLKCFSYINIFQNVMYSSDAKAKFSTAITPGFSVTWFF